MEILFYIMLILAAVLFLANVVLSIMKKRRMRDAKKAFAVMQEKLQAQQAEAQVIAEETKD